MTHSTTGEIDFYAGELEGDKTIKKTLEQLLSELRIDNYEINHVFNLDGSKVEVDAAVTDFGRTIALWYQGEHDGQHSTEKQTLQKNSINYVQIEACTAQELRKKIITFDSQSWLIIPESEG